MAKLILSMDGLVLKEIPLDQERITIGRRASNDVQIDNLAISGEHAVVVTILNDSFLEDLNSTNGTLVNGQAVKKHFLRNSDVIELGKYKLKYLVESPQSTADGFEKTVMIRPDGGAKADSGAVTVPPGIAPAGIAPPDTQAPRAPVRAAAIQLLNGANAGKEMDLVKTLTTLGKPGGQVAVIARRPQGYFVTHVEGAQFPVVNGKMIDTQAQALADHDVIEIAGVKMEFFFKS
jgi:pSer/pThr/pTyr-binding forkhead associated (FHA) protein